MDELVGSLDIDLGAVDAGAGGNSSLASLVADAASPSPTVGPTEPPRLNEIHVPSPGTRTVFQWPEVVTMVIKPKFRGHDIVLTWPFVDWPGFDILRPEHRYFGHSGIVYFSGGRWHAISTEWLRIGREHTGTYYPFEEKFVEGHPRAGYPIGFFIAGPWRHQPDREQYHRRSNITWYKWPSLEPFTFPGGNNNPPAAARPRPRPEPAARARPRAEIRRSPRIHHRNHDRAGGWHDRQLRHRGR